MAELLGGKVSGRSGTGEVTQAGGHAGRLGGVGRRGGQPAPTPEASRVEADGFLSGNLGIDVISNRPVAAEIWEVLPNTLILCLVGLGWAWREVRPRLRGSLPWRRPVVPAAPSGSAS